MARSLRHVHTLWNLAEKRVLITLGALASLVWAFIVLAGEMLEGDTRAIDSALLLTLRNPEDRAQPWGPPWVQEMARDFTALGGIAVLTSLVLAVIGYLILIQKRRAAVAVALAVAGGQLMSSLLKVGFDRPRPDLVPHGVVVYTASFPSGHAMMAAVTYLTLGALLVRMHPSVGIKMYFIGVAVLLTLVVGISRVYLGVHWPSDVLAGWTMGAAWALSCSAAIGVLQMRGTVERAGS